MVVSPEAKRETLRTYLKGQEAMVAPGSFDSLSARLVERAGFKVAYATGHGMARSTGYPDVGLLTMTEVVQRVGQIAESIDIPLVADADTGYGNALNVMRTVREMARAGAAAIHLEDQLFPKRCSHLAAEGLEKDVISKEEMVGKIRAAVEASADSGLVNIARIDARGRYGLEDVLARAEAYLEAGADAVFPINLSGVEEYRQFAERISAPKICILPQRSYGFERQDFPRVTDSDLLRQLTVEEFGRMGYRLVIFPGSLAMAACQAMARLLVAVQREGTDAGYFAAAGDYREVWQWYYLSGVSQIRDWEARFLLQQEA